MKSLDKFILGIIGAVTLLVLIAFTVAFFQPKPTYQSDATAEGVAHNYLFALKQNDFVRAYGYLSPQLKGYPESVEAFENDIRTNRWNFGKGENTQPTLEVLSTTIQPNDRARVTVQERRFYQGGLFSNSDYATQFEMILRLEAGQWKLITADSYWLGCWDEEAGCQ